MPSGTQFCCLSKSKIATFYFVIKSCGEAYFRTSHTHTTMEPGRNVCSIARRKNARLFVLLGDSLIVASVANSNSHIMFSGSATVKLTVGTSFDNIYAQNTPTHGSEWRGEERRPCAPCVQGRQSHCHARRPPSTAPHTSAPPSEGPFAGHLRASPVTSPPAARASCTYTVPARKARACRTLARLRGGRERIRHSAAFLLSCVDKTW